MSSSSSSTDQAPRYKTLNVKSSAAEILAAFQEDGVVVVEDILTAEEVEEGLQELWTSPRLLARPTEEGRPAVSRDDPDSWRSAAAGGSWPQQDGGKNFLSSLDVMSDRQGWKLAQNPELIRIMELLYQLPQKAAGEEATEQLLLDSVGRWGVMRPTEGHPEWRTEENWMHWDQSPYTEPGFVRVQAFVCFSEQSASAGGLLCVPGFQKDDQWGRWIHEHPEGSVVVQGATIDRQYGRGKPFPLPADDPCLARAVQIHAQPGSLVAWDSRLPHQNYPNAGSQFRVVHYLNFIKAGPSDVETRRQEMRKKIAVHLLKQIDTSDSPSSSADSSSSSTSLSSLSTSNPFAFWPHRISALGCKIIGLPLLSEGELSSLLPAAPLRDALLLSLKAGALEVAGDFEGSARLLRSAEKLYPQIDEWYGALFGT